MNFTSLSGRNYIFGFVFLVIGFFIGLFFSVDKMLIKTAVIGGVESESVVDPLVKEKLEWVEGFEVNPLKIADFVEDNAAGYVDEDGNVYFFDK